MSHTFRQVVFGLQIIHKELWFSTNAELSELTHCDKWRGSEILSTGGRVLAMQTGHPDEWEFTPLSDKPDTGLIIDEPDDDSAITADFLKDVGFWMTMLVHPYVDENGVFVTENDRNDSCYSG
ncbi:hypothetical protein ACN5L4_003690 [Cronobacter turicensis]